MSEWLATRGEVYHAARLKGRPVLLFGTPRYGPTGERAAIGYFITGHGWIEQGIERSFEATHWMPLPAPPEQGTDHG